MEILLAAAVLPVIALCYYIYKKDVNKEPKEVLRKLFGYGCLTVIPILIVEIILDPFFSTANLTSFVAIFINTFIAVALVEEGFKWIVTKKFGYDNKEFDEVYDIIVYSVFASLGFACVENILYVLSNGLGNAIVRAFTSIPGHTCFGVMMGYYFSKAKVNYINGNDSLYRRNLLLSILMPTLFHTTYDAIIFYYVAIESLFIFFLFVIFVIAMVVLCFKIVKKASRVQQTLTKSLEKGIIRSNSSGHVEYHPTNTNSINYCPVCGKDVRGYNYCPSCGFHIR